MSASSGPTAPRSSETAIPPEHKATAAIGDVALKVPRVSAKDGTTGNFISTMVPKYLRTSKFISVWAAHVYLNGVSECDMAAVLGVIMGEGAKSSPAR